MCDAMVWQKGELWLFYHERWTSWFVADKLVPQDPSNPQEDPWEQVEAYARVAGYEYQGKCVPGGPVFLPWNSQEPAEGFRVLSKGNFIVEMANELWSFYQAEMQNSTELKEQIQELQSQNQAERELHATELQQLREEKTQLQAQHARELQQLGQQQPPGNQPPPAGAAEARAWMDKAQELQQELEHVKYQKSVLERQKALLESNLTPGKGGAPVS